LPELQTQNWFIAYSVADGVEIRPHPRLLRRFAIFSTVVNTVLATLAMVVALWAWSFVCFILIASFIKKLGEFGVYLGVTLIILGVLAAVAFVVFAAKKTYRRAISDQSEPLRISANGTVSRGAVEYIVGRLAASVRVYRVTVTDTEGTDISYHVCLVKPSGDQSLPMPIPDPRLGFWDEKASRVDVALAFANLIGQVLNIPVDDETNRVESM
jgi:hypothetical protein